MTELELFKNVCCADILQYGDRVDAEGAYTRMTAIAKWEQKVPTIRIKRIIRVLMRELADRATETAIEEMATVYELADKEEGR